MFEKREENEEKQTKHTGTTGGSRRGGYGIDDGVLAIRRQL